MRIHLVQHVSYYYQTNVEKWAIEKEHAVSKTFMQENEDLPGLDEFDWLIIMGGPMDIYDAKRYPWLVKEKKFIASAIESKKIVLGICLGGQLIADTLGAKVYMNCCREIGWYPVSLTKEAKESKVFRKLPDNFTTFFWHEDGFEIPEGGKRMAVSECCMNQAFEYNDRVIGLQFHLESSPESVGNMLHCTKCMEYITGGGKYIQGMEEIMEHKDFFEETYKAMHLLMDAIEEEYAKESSSY